MLKCHDCRTTIDPIYLEEYIIFDGPECEIEPQFIGYELSMLHLGLSEE